MVLGQMGECISRALQQMGNAVIIDDQVIKKCLNEINHALFQSDVRIEIISDIQFMIRQKVDSLAAGHNKRRIVQQAVFDVLCAKMSGGKLSFTPKKGNKNVIMFVGLQGSGKTTTCTKYASYYQKRGFRPALVCADTFRAGAFDQLKQNARKNTIPYYGSYLESDPVKVAIEGVKRFKGEDERYKEENHDLIIVDTSGRHKQEDSLFEEMRQLSNAIKPDLVIFVLDSSIGQAAFDQALAFKKNVPVGAVIVTKMDGHSKGGGALSAVAATKSPVIFIGTGEHMHEFEVFDVKPFVGRLLGLGDWSGFVDKVREVVTTNQQSELVQKLSEGSFTLRLMYEQFQNILKIGPISQVVSMIPGYSAPAMRQGDEVNLSKIKRYMTMMDSVTNKELDTADPKLINESRMMRIARGSGRSLGDVMDMMAEFKRMAKLWKNMMGVKIPKRGKMNAQQMSRVLPPQLLNQVGGMSRFENFMRQMGNTSLV